MCQSIFSDNHADGMSPEFVMFVLSLAPLLNSQTAESEEKFEGKKFALLAAGSRGYDNYRHQADVCHSYHVLRDNGIPEENIVLMMFDDVATDRKNPTPGVLINAPNGTDVYKGVKIDYREDDVTPENFLAVLRGDKEAMAAVGTGRVIESGPEDHIFVYFVDHGLMGMLSFPDSILVVGALRKTVLKMAGKKQFAKMMMFIEACYSGSMFHGSALPTNVGVYAMSAASTNQSSYACFFDMRRGTYLADVYSVAWMNFATTMDLSSYRQYEMYDYVYGQVVSFTKKCTPKEYGDLRISRLLLEKLIGSPDIGHAARSMPRSLDITDAVPAEDVYLETMKRTMQPRSGMSARIQEQIDLYRQTQRKTDALFDLIFRTAAKGNEEVMNKIVSAEYPELHEENRSCYEDLVLFFNHKCISVSHNAFVARHLTKLATLCSLEEIIKTNVMEIINSACRDNKLNSLRKQLQKFDV